MSVAVSSRAFREKADWLMRSRKVVGFGILG